MRVTRKTENEALMTMLNGVEELLETAGQSLGPFGRATALIPLEGGMVYTSHGIEIAEAFQVEDSLEQIGVRFLRQAAQEVNRLAGDGTTTAMIVTGSLFQGAVKLMTSGQNSIAIRSGILQGLEAALKSIQGMSRPLHGSNELRAVALTASRGDDRDIDALIEASETAGEFGYISVEVKKPSNVDHEFRTSISVTSGIQAGRILGFTESAPLDCPFDVIVLEDQIFRKIKPEELFARLPRKHNPILLVANSLRTNIYPEADDSSKILEALLTQAESQNIQLIIVVNDQYSSYPLTTRDVAAFAGTTLVSHQRSQTLPIGEVDNVGQEGGTIILSGGRPNSAEFKAHTTALKSVEPEDFDSVLRKRLALLLGKYVTVTAFELSDETRRERSTTLANAVHAIANAQKLGVVAGAGTALAGAANAITEERPENDIERFGFESVRRALTQPVRYIAKNAGKEPEAVLEQIQQGGFKYVFNVKTGRVCDLAESGIVDPTVNVLAILRTSISTVRAMLNVSSLIHVENTTASEEVLDRMGAPGVMGSVGRRFRQI